MYARISTVVLLLALAWSSSVFAQPVSTLDAVRSRGTLRWGADKEGGGPFVFPAADGSERLEGFEVELAAVLAERLGVRAEFVQGQWDQLPNLLDRGDIDIVLNGYEWLPARAARYGTSVPYYIYELQLLARKDDASLRSWEDVLNPPSGVPKRIAVLGGSAAEDYLRQPEFAGIDLVNYDGAADAMRAVELNTDGLDANLQDLPVWTFYQGGYPDLTAIGDPVGRGYYVVLVRKGDADLLKEINAAIRQALSDGTLGRIYSKYRMWNRAQAQRALETDDNGNFLGDSSGAGVQDGDEEQEYVPVRGWELIRQRGGLLLRAAGMTVLLSIASMPLAILLGLCLALMRRYGPWFLRMPATLYVEVVRGTPLVLQLFVIFFLLPEIGISINAFLAAVLGLAVNYSAYEAEIYRAGLQAVPRGQMEAALALGMSRRMAVQRVIVPQATRLVIPPVTNDFIALFKDTAVCSVITVVELSKQYSIEARSTGGVVELGILTAVLYLSMSYPLSILAGRLERTLTPEDRA